MQTAAQARNSSNNTLTGLTYIDTLVSDTIIQGKYSIVIESKYITEDMITELKSNGYSVIKRNTSNELFDPYIISWLLATPTPEGSYNLLVGSFGSGPDIVGYYPPDFGSLDNTSFEGVTIQGITIQCIESQNPIDILVEVSEQIVGVVTISITVNEVTVSLTWSSKKTSYEGQSQDISDYMFDNIGETIIVELSTT